jgi:hypothetical protein
MPNFLGSGVPEYPGIDFLPEQQKTSTMENTKLHEGCYFVKRRVLYGYRFYCAGA